MLQQFYPVIPHGFMHELNKDMNFAAAHYIPHEDAGGCAKVHGHTYFVNVTIVGNELDHMGFLVNFQEIKKAVHGRYDHTLLNDHTNFAGSGSQLKTYPAPSTENVAEAIYDEVAKVLHARYDETGQKTYCLQVIVRETPTSYVTYRNPAFLPGGPFYGSK